MTKDKANRRAMAFYKSSETYSSNDTFFLLRKYCRTKTLLGAAISNAGGEEQRSDGLVAGHAYSVLDARSFTDGGSTHDCTAAEPAASKLIQFSVSFLSAVQNGSASPSRW